MERQTNFHPVYVSGQYLTSEHLNETHNFLWQEEKATRYALTGNGIASGLNADLTEVAGQLQAVTVTKGAAATVDGYLVSPAADLSLTKAAAVTLTLFTLDDGTSHLMYKGDFDKVADSLNAVSSANVDAFELFDNAVPDTDLPDGTGLLNAATGLTATDVLANFLVLCWVFARDKENNQCEQGDCNTKGTQRNYSAKFFLLKKTAIPEQNTIADELITCTVARIKNLSAAGSSAGLFAKSFEAWSASFGELRPYFTGTQANKQLLSVASLLTEADKTRLTNSVAAFDAINAGVTVQNCPQYYASFASDLAKAINELVVFYNEYIANHVVMKPGRTESIILLGSLRQNGIDKWRYYFQPAADLLESHAGWRKLRKLFIRVLAMVESFIRQDIILARAANVPGRPLAIPSLTGGLLQNAAIPYYFDTTTIDNNLLKFWNPGGGGLRNVFSFYDGVTVGRNDMVAKMKFTSWTDQNFFRIEGHIGLPKQNALSALTALISADGLPIQVIDCNVNYRGPQNWLDWYLEFVKNIKDWTSALKKEAFDKKYVYDYSPIKKIQEEITQTSFREMDKVSKLYNDFTAYTGVFYKTTATPQGIKAKAGRAAAKASTPAGAAVKGSSIDANVIQSYKTVVKTDQVAQLASKYKLAVADQGDKTKEKLIILSDLADLEYMGGTVRGGTFVLLHDGTTVIGDGSLPYYYRINGARVFNT